MPLVVREAVGMGEQDGERALYEVKVAAGEDEAEWGADTVGMAVEVELGAMVGMVLAEDEGEAVKVGEASLVGEGVDILVGEEVVFMVEVRREEERDTDVFEVALAVADGQVSTTAKVESCPTRKQVNTPSARTLHRPPLIKLLQTTAVSIAISPDIR